MEYKRYYAHGIGSHVLLSNLSVKCVIVLMFRKEVRLLKIDLPKELLAINLVGNLALTI